MLNHDFVSFFSDMILMLFLIFMLDLPLLSTILNSFKDLSFFTLIVNTPAAKE